MRKRKVISIAFRIWLIRNVDLVKATFECKFRVFLEWLDDGAIGMEKGKKARFGAEWQEFVRRKS